MKMTQLVKIKAQVPSIWANGWVYVGLLCVRNLTRHDYPSLMKRESRGIGCLRVWEFCSILPMTLTYD